MSLGNNRDNTLLARQTEAVRQMLSFNQVTTVSISIKNIKIIENIENFHFDISLISRLVEMCHQHRLGKFWCMTALVNLFWLRYSVLKSYEKWV